MPKELFLSCRLPEHDKHVMLMPQNIIYNEELSPHFSQEILDKICEVYQALTLKEIYCLFTARFTLLPPNFTSLDFVGLIYIAFAIKCPHAAA